MEKNFIKNSCPSYNLMGEKKTMHEEFPEVVKLVDGITLIVVGKSINTDRNILNDLIDLLTVKEEESINAVINE